MKALARLALAWMALSVPISALAQTEAPVTVVNLVETSGAAKIPGTNFKNGVELAFKEINAAGGILGKKINVVTTEIPTDAEVAKAKMREAVAFKPYAVMGPVFSSMVLATMEETQRAEIPNFVGGEAASITQRGNPYVFRTSFTQATAMPKVARYMKDALRVKTVAIVWVDNDFGKGGHEEMLKALQALEIKVLADLPIKPLQSDFKEAVASIERSDADAAFIYLNEEETPHLLQALFRSGYDGWLVGETTLMSQAVIDRVREASSAFGKADVADAVNGVQGHVGLTADALVPAIRSFHNRFLKEYNYKSDHNGMKGYTAAYILKAMTERIGKFDSKALAQAMKGATLLANDHRRILLDVKYDDKGDLDRESFIVRVNGGRHEFIATVPPAVGAIAPPAQKTN
jgi:branched-chain amino acid transport system substrate-binding protein